MLLFDRRGHRAQFTPAGRTLAGRRPRAAGRGRRSRAARAARGHRLGDRAADCRRHADSAGARLPAGRRVRRELPRSARRAYAVADLARSARRDVGRARRRARRSRAGCARGRAARRWLPDAHAGRHDERVRRRPAASAGRRARSRCRKRHRSPSRRGRRRQFAPARAAIDRNSVRTGHADRSGPRGEAGRASAGIGVRLPAARDRGRRHRFRAPRRADRGDAAPAAARRTRRGERRGRARRSHGGSTRSARRIGVFLPSRRRQPRAVANVRGARLQSTAPKRRRAERGNHDSGRPASDAITSAALRRRATRPASRSR